MLVDAGTRVLEHPGMADARYVGLGFTCAPYPPPPKIKLHPLIALWATGAGYRISWTPLGHCPRDVIRPPKKLKKHTHSWTFTSTPPLGHCPCDVIRPPKKLKNTPTLGHSQAHLHPPTHTHTPLDIARVTSSSFQGGGGGDRSRSRTLCIGFQYQDKFQGGGGDHPYHHHPPPGSATGATSPLSTVPFEKSTNYRPTLVFSDTSPVFIGIYKNIHILILCTDYNSV